MTPNFTLSLSFEGIRLLQRVPDGWHLIGEVPLDAPDLGSALADLRKTALELSPDGLHTKLLIPNEQIKYTAIDSTRTELDDIHAALDGATPYAIADLAIDFDRAGGRTHIAAVARETLIEAEGFATEHKFNPVCFAAVAEPLTFRSEVFFGMTELAKQTLAPGVEIVRDDAAVEITGEIASEAVAEVERPEIADDAPTVAEDAATEDDVVDVVFASRSRVKPTDPVVTPIDPPQIEPLFTSRKEEPEVATPTLVAPAVAAASPPPFGDPKQPKTSGRPKHLVWILLGLLLLFMAAVAMWANTLAPTGIAGWLRGTPEEPPAIVATPEAIIAPTPDPTVVTALPSSTPSAPEATQVVEPVATVSAPIEETAAPLPAPTSPDGTLPIVREATGRVLSPSEADRTYAATGVYQRAPRMPLVPQTATLDGFQAAVALPATAPLSALTLPDMALMFPDQVITPQLDPPPPGVTFARDIRGFILASPEGRVMPNGAFVIAGAPDRLPPLRPGTVVPETPVIATEPDGDVGLRLVAGRPPLVPPLRPDGLAPAPEQVVAAPLPTGEEGLNLVTGRPPRTPPLRPEAFAAFATPTDIVAEPEEPATEIAAVVVNPADAVGQNGVALRTLKPTLRPAGFVAPDVVAFASDPTLAGARPALRPEGLAPAEPEPEVAATTPDTDDVTDLIANLVAAAPASPIVTPTARAIVASPRPDTRPRNIATLVSNALARQQTAPATTAVAAAPSRATGPVPNSVAQAATIDNAIRLRDLNLIGVYGRSSDRRALVRLSNGRYVKVEVGSSLDGGQVTAIGDSALNYVKRGRTYALELPSG